MSVLLSDFIYLFSQLWLKLSMLHSDMKEEKSRLSGVGLTFWHYESMMSPTNRSRDNWLKHVFFILDHPPRYVSTCCFSKLFEMNYE